jgi:hypothetical protein
MTCTACSKPITLQPLDPPLLEEACMTCVYLADGTELAFHWSCYTARFDGPQVRLDAGA